MPTDNELELPPLSCEFMLNERLELHVSAIRCWLGEMGQLVADAVMTSGGIESCGELFDDRFWNSSVRTGEPTNQRNSRLSKRTWNGILGASEILNLGIALSPRPGVPSNRGPRSTILLDTAWYDDLPNRVSFSLPARYVSPAPSSTWSVALVGAFKKFCLEANVQTAYIGWTSPMQYLSNPIGSIDFKSTILAPGWALMIGDGHMDRLGGFAQFANTHSDLYSVERGAGNDGQIRYYLQLTQEPFDLLRPEAKPDRDGGADSLRVLMPSPPSAPSN